MMKSNILQIVPDFNYCNGRANYVFLLSKYLLLNDYNVTVVTNGGDSLERLKSLKINFHILKNLHRKNIFSIIKNISDIKEILLSQNINIIHTHHRYDEILANYARKKTDAKSVITVLSILKFRYFNEYKSDKIIAISNTVRKNLIDKFKIEYRKIQIIPNFIDRNLSLERSNIFENKYTLKNKCILFSAGRFHYEKNYETLIKSLSLLKNRNIILKLVGEGKREKRYRSIADKYNLSLLLISPKKDLGKYFLESSICILPSKIDPFPFFMLDSGVYRKPFIGSSVDGIKELIKHKKNGLLFEPGNYFDLAEKIEMFLNDPELMNKCAENLHKEVTENYTPKKIMPQIINVYENLLKNGNKNS